ncbi:LIM domain only protein 3 [Anabarilius grahami]|uniref:LIM domain only protein 3 n=1 Tax=Anabarilius grahami TaxID=495550 RepID=A0A3N0XDD7_ANAGA|nr:LIM domain only protein 3 [Anabarilius grahami]
MFSPSFHPLLPFSAGIQMLSVQPDTKPKGCAGCNRKIKDRYLLKALDKYWHEDCLKCACCDCRLGEVGSTLYTKANLILCRRDYLRHYKHKMSLKTAESVPHLKETSLRALRQIPNKASATKSHIAVNTGFNGRP